MEARDLCGPPPPDLMMTPGYPPVTRPEDLPLNLTAADIGKTWQVERWLYVWQQDHYRIYCADL